MAMTKVEKAEMELLRTKLALRWSGTTPPETMPLPDRGYINGWWFNSYDSRISPAWTESNGHGIGQHRSDDGSNWRDRPMGSQNGLRIYATKREALVALRLAKEAEFAAALRRIDAMIEEEPV